MKENRAVFYELREGIPPSAMYNWFHKLNAGGKYGLWEVKAPLRFFSQEVWPDPEIRNNFKRFASNDDFGRVEAAEVGYRDKATLEELVDSGVLEVIPDKEVESPKNSE